MQPPDHGQGKSVGVCQTCGKQKGPTISGSITAWIFKDSCCRCDEGDQSLTDNESDIFAKESKASKAPPKAAPNQPIRKFGERYEILETIGEGGMATVYKVRDLVLNQFYAIKVIRPEYARDPITRKRFEQESTAARELNHANIVTMYAFDVSPEKIAYIIMDFVDGEDLGKILDRGPLSLPVFYETFTQVCSALAHAHSRGVVHRDIKPSNILVANISQKTTWVKIVDFGIAKVMNAGDSTQVLTKTGDFLGSPLYTSPEQAQGEDVDARSDIYSLGCVMFHAITGRPPFKDASAVKLIMQHCNTLPPKVVPLSGDRCPLSLERVILRCLEKRPEDRYQNVFDLRTDLQLVQDHKEPQMRKNVSASMQNVLTDFFDHSKKENYSTVFDGTLSFDMRIKNVMERILELAIPGDSLLRLESGNPEFEGIIVIRDGVQILGAKILRQNMQGYDALRKMLGLADGQFHYQSIAASDYKLPDLSLQLNLNYILFLYPSLPESPSELLDQAAIHDLVDAVKMDEEDGDDSEMGSELRYDTNSGARQANNSDDDDDAPQRWMTVGAAKPPEKPKSAFAAEIEREIGRFDNGISGKTPSAKKFKKGFQRSPIRIALLLLFIAGLGWGAYNFLMMPASELTHLRNSLFGSPRPPVNKQPTKKHPGKKHPKKH